MIEIGTIHIDENNAIAYSVPDEHLDKLTTALNAQEANLRELIAKEIEEACDASLYDHICGHCLFAAEIARGQK